MTWKLDGNILMLNDERSPVSACLILNDDQTAVVGGVIEAIGEPFYDADGEIHPGWRPEDEHHDDGPSDEERAQMEREAEREAEHKEE